MRSFVALLSLAAATTVFASPLGDASLLGRDYPLLSTRSPVPEFDNSYDFDVELVERNIAQMAVAEGLTKRDLSKRQVSHDFVHSVQCGTSRPANNAACESAVPASQLPTNGRAVCNVRKGTCEVACQPGFVPRNYMCYKSATQCGSTTCPNTPPNGLYQCSPARGRKACRLLCRKQLQPNRKGTKCLDLQNDPYHCGAESNKCPHSYNGHGKRVCEKGVCTGRCIPGNILRKTSTGRFYCTRPR